MWDSNQAGEEPTQKVTTSANGWATGSHAKKKWRGRGKEREAHLLSRKRQEVENQTARGVTSKAAKQETLGGINNARTVRGAEPSRRKVRGGQGGGIKLFVRCSSLGNLGGGRRSSIPGAAIAKTGKGMQSGRKGI